MFKKMETPVSGVLNKKRLQPITMHEDKIWARTDFNKNVYIWNIEKLESLEKNEEYCTLYGETEWFFMITKTDSFYDIKIDTVSSVYDGEMTLRVSFLEESSRPLSVTRRPDFMYQVQVPIEYVHMPGSKFVSFDFIWHASRNLVHVKCNRPLTELGQNSKEKPPFKEFANSWRRWCTDYFIVGQEEYFKAHKSVLAARSDFFREMFHGASSSDTEKLLLRHVESDVIIAFLRYIYTGEECVLPTDNKRECLNDLLKQYGIPRTKYKARFYSSKDTEFPKYDS